MGLFQRSSHKTQHQQHASTSSVQRHPQNLGFSEEQENRQPTSVSVASSKKRGLLKGLIRGRTPERERYPLPPPSQTGPLSEAKSPPQIQNLPTVSATTQHELRQKLKEAQKVEAFLSQANTFKPTVGGSDIEFLFNHIATPTAGRAGQAAGTLGSIGIKEAKKKAEHSKRGKTRQQEDRNGVRKSDVRGENSTKSVQSIPLPTGPNNPQSPFHSHRYQQQKQHHHQSSKRRQSRKNDQSEDHDTINTDIQSYNHQGQYSGSYNNPQHQHRHANNNPEHVRGGRQLQSWMDNNPDTYSIDNSSKRSIGWKSKKPSKRAFFHNPTTRPDLGAFESEDTYYAAMRTLEEGRQFQNVSQAFMQHFQGNKSQASSAKRSKSAPRERPRDAHTFSSPPQAKTTDDVQSHKSNPKSTASSHWSNAASSYHNKSASIASPNNSSIATPLRGILKKGKFGASPQTSVTEQNKFPQQGRTVETDPVEEEERGGGHDQVYTSSSSDDMFIGIRPSSSSESSALYTDDGELIELRARLNSPEKEGAAADGSDLPESRDTSSGVRLVGNHNFHRDDSLTSPLKHASQNSRSKHGSQHLRDKQGSQHSRSQHSGGQDFHQHKEIRENQANAVAQSDKKSLGDADLQAISSDETSDGLKFFQDRFAHMLNSVGTFHEKQNQKIEELRKTFASAITTTSEDAEKPKSTEATTDIPPKILDDRVDAKAEATDKQDALYRQMMNGDGQAAETAAINLIKERSATSLNPPEPSGQAAETAAINLIKERSATSLIPPERSGAVTLVKERSVRSEILSEGGRAASLITEKSATSEKPFERGRVAKLLKERSATPEKSSARTKFAKTVERFQTKKVFQREETQKLMSQPQFVAEIASKTVLKRQEGEAQENKGRKAPLVDEDDPSLAQVMDLHPSSSSSEVRENLRQYWESHQSHGKESSVVGSIIRSDHGRMGLALPDSQGNRRGLHHHNQMKAVFQSARNRTQSQENKLVEEQPLLDKGSSLNEDGAMDGVVFSIESEDDSHLKDAILSNPRSGRVSRTLYDGPIPSAKSSFSMARSRQLSLVDSVFSEDETVSSVTTDLLNNEAGAHKSDEQIASLLARIGYIEQRNRAPNDHQEESVDRTVSDEISEIKSILEGLKAQTNRRINQQDPPQDDSKRRRDAPDKRDAPGNSIGNDPDRLDQNRSSGSSTASSGYVKRTLGLDPIEDSRNASPRKPPSNPTKAANYGINGSGGKPQKTPTHLSGGYGARSIQESRSAAPNENRFPGGVNNHQPQQLLGGARNMEEGGREWPQTDGNGFSVMSGLEHTQSEFGRNAGSHHGSQIGNHSLHGTKTFSVSGVEQTVSEYGRAAGSSQFGNHSAYSGKNTSAMGVGVERKHSELGRTAGGHSSQIGSNSAYSGHSGPHRPAYSPHPAHYSGKAFSPHPAQQQAFPPHPAHYGGKAYSNPTQQQGYASSAVQLFQQHQTDTHQRFQHHTATAGSPYPNHQPMHHHSAAVAHQAAEELFYSRTESDLTFSVALEEGPSKEKEPSLGHRPHKSNRAATYFDTLSVGVKAVGSFDSVSDRYSASTNSKKTRGSSHDSQTKTLKSDSGTLDTISASRSPTSKDDDTRSTLPSKEKDIRSRIFRNAKSHIVAMGKNGDISEPFKARVLRVMDPLVGKSSDDDDDDESVDEATGEENPSPPQKGYLPACHFFCG